MELFWLKGFGSTSIADILSRSQVNSGSLYYFFKTKEELLLAVLDWYMENLFPVLIQPIIAHISDPVERVFALLDGYRKALVATGCTYGCPIGSLSPALRPRRQRR